jgi:glycosyltransferase involved in cell wall biosynthesis
MSKENLKITLFAAKLSSRGGAEKVILEEADYFLNKKVSLGVLVFEFDPCVLAGDKQIPVKALGGRSFFDKLKLLRRELINTKPDIVIGHNNEDCLFIYLASFFLGIKYATHIFGTIFWFDDDFKKYSLVHRRVFRLIRDSVIGHREFLAQRANFTFSTFLKTNLMAILDILAVRRARFIVTLNEHLRWEIKNIYHRDSVICSGCLSSQWLKCQPGYDWRKELGLEGKKIVLSISRLDHRKRLKLLIEAFHKITDQRNDLVLLIGGSGKEEFKLRQLSEQLGIKENVIFLGAIEETRLRSLYQAADVFVFIAWTSFGITRFEALAAGAKSVWSSEVGKKEISAWEGMVFPADPEVNSLAAAILKALGEPAARPPDLSAYLWKNYFDQLNELVLSTVSGGSLNART